MLHIIFNILLDNYAPQGWWPVYNSSKGCFEYSGKAPQDNDQAFEITVGAILTQSVSWSNVEKALLNLYTAGLLIPRKMHEVIPERLALLIQPAGYYNQKAKKLHAFLDWFKTYNYSYKGLPGKTAYLRNELLGIFGIGPETADSILLYALRHKIFVVDAYTKRIFSRIGLFNEKKIYEEIQCLFHNDFRGSIQEYNEYHALIVAHAKNNCKKRPLCDLCCLREICKKRNI